MDKYAILKHYFGYENFKKGQEDIINHLLNGQDVVGILPTGAGKSICYQVPALMFSGVTLVISPLISLMKDQVDTLNEMGINATFINSSLSPIELEDVINHAQNGAYKLIYVAPERLETTAFINLMNSISISFIAVDEAHCVSQWGHDFRPSYTRIIHIVNGLKRRPIIGAFTATATPEVKVDIINSLQLNNPYCLTTGFDRENLYFEVVKPQNKLQYLRTYLQEHKGNSGVIYCSTRKSVEAVSDHLSDIGFQVTKYHAGLTEEERTKNQEDFIYDRKPIIVATNAFGMGIDKSNIRFVIHFNMPKNMESYYQEAGRAGRDGENAECILLFGASDIVTNKLLIQNNTDENQTNEYQKLNEIVTFCNMDGCLRTYILNYFGQNDIKQECGNCGNCNNEVEKKDITVEAQKIMSCVKRMDERFGAALVADVLAGANSEKIRSFKFNELTTYGIMKEYPKDQIKEMISFLVAEGYLDLMGDKFPILKLNTASFSVLKGQEMVFIKRHINKKLIKVINDLPVNEDLFEMLRTLRKELAEKQKVPPFVIFSDASLRDMCIKYPTNAEEFLTVNGVGKAKLESYGELFMKLISQFLRDQGIKKEVNNTIVVDRKQTNSPNQASRLITYELYKQGHTIEEMMKIRQVSQTTIENHLIDCFNDGLEYKMDIDQDIEQKIIQVCNELNTNMLRPIKEALPEEVTYFQIKYVMLKNKVEKLL